MLTLTLNQYLALIATTTTLTPSDFVTLADSGANISSLSATQIGALAGNGVDRIDATDNALTLSMAQYQTLRATTTTLTPADVVTLADLGFILSALSAAQIGILSTLLIDKIDATDNALTLNVAQYQALGTVALTAADTVTLADTGSNVSALTATQIGALSANLVDRIVVTDNAMSLTVAAYRALIVTPIIWGGPTKLADSGANIASMTASELSALASHNITNIDATDDALSLRVAQYQALGVVTLTAADFVTLSDTAANLAALSVAQIGALSGKGIDKIDATDATLNLSVAQVSAIGAVTFGATHSIAIVDAGANVAALSAAALASISTAGVNIIDTSDNVLNLTAAQAKSLGNIVVAAGDVVTLNDTGANIAGLSMPQFAALASHHIINIDATDNALSLSLGQYQALGTVALTAADTVTLAETGANLSALTATQFGALAGKQIDQIHAVDGALSLRVDQYRALGTVVLTAADTGTLADTGANIAAMTATQIASLAAHGIDKINATDDVLRLTFAQYQALGTVALDPSDNLIIVDGGFNAITFLSSSTATTPENVPNTTSIYKTLAYDSGLMWYFGPASSSTQVVSGASNLSTLDTSNQSLASLDASSLDIASSALASLDPSSLDLANLNSSYLYPSIYLPSYPRFYYSISGGVDANLFTINPYTGVVTFKDPPDFEAPKDQGADNVYNITVRATEISPYIWYGPILTPIPLDAASLTDAVTASIYYPYLRYADKPVAITVTNVNEPPIITSAAAVTTPENVSPSNAVYTIRATDPENVSAVLTPPSIECGKQRV